MKKRLRHRRIITDDLNCYLSDLLKHSYIEIFQILEPVTNCFDVFYYVVTGVIKDEQH